MSDDLEVLVLAGKSLGLLLLGLLVLWGLIAWLGWWTLVVVPAVVAFIGAWIMIFLWLDDMS